MPEDLEVLTPEQKKEAALARFKGTPSAETKTPDQIAAEKEEAEKLAAAKLEEENKNKQQAAAPPAPVELTDDQILELIGKKTGRKFTSFEEFKPTPEIVDKEKEAEKREADKLTYGLKKGLFNKNQYESFVTDKSNPVALVYKAELEDAKAADPDWDAEKEKEFKEEFDAKFGLDLDGSSPKHKRGQKQISIIAENILRQTYPGILNLDSEYIGYETQAQSKAAQQKKIVETAPIYKKDVEEVIASLGEIDVDFDEKESYKVKVPQEILDSVQETLMDKNFVTSKILEGYTKEEITQIARTMAISQNFGAFAREAAKLARHKQEKGLRGIPEGGVVITEKNQYENLSESQKTAINFFKPATTAN